MMRRFIALAFAGASALTTAPAASAATLQTDSRCYQETQEVVLKGTGYTPLSTVTVTQDGQPLGTAQADADGAFQRKFATPELPTASHEKLYSLTATDSLNSATTSYRATKVFADFSPGSGDPTRLRVRFDVYGFGLARPRATVYLHYVQRSTGKARRTVKLGSVRGTCGVMKQAKPRKLFPFKPEQGTWILQFDTLKRYERATSRRTTPWVRKPVEVFTRHG